MRVYVQKYRFPARVIRNFAADNRELLIINYK